MLYIFINLLQLETEKEELDSVQQSIDVVKSDLRKEQQNLAQLQSKMANEKLSWAKERADLLAHIKKVGAYAIKLCSHFWLFLIKFNYVSFFVIRDICLKVWLTLKKKKPSTGKVLYS